MRKILVVIFILMNSMTYGQINGKVISVTNGDSFVLFTNEHKQIKVKLYGIDAPLEEQAYSSKARSTLIGLISNQNIELDIKIKNKDGHTVGIATIDNIVINEAMLSEGMVWHNKKEDKSDKYAKLEANARKNKIGLWSELSPISPWAFKNRR